MGAQDSMIVFIVGIRGRAAGMISGHAQFIEIILNWNVGRINFDPRKIRKILVNLFLNDTNWVIRLIVKTLIDLVQDTGSDIVHLLKYLLKTSIKDCCSFSVKS